MSDYIDVDDSYGKYKDMTHTFNSTIPHVVCPKHGEHPHSILSTIPGHEGRWCQICWLEMIGEPLPVIERPYVPEE